MTDAAPRALLCVLSERTSKRTGQPYLVGWLGGSKLLAFPGKDADRYGNPTWDLYVVETEPRRDDSRPVQEPAQGTESAGNPQPQS